MLNVRKRPAPEPILPISSRKQRRTALFNTRGENQSPSSDEGLLSRWRDVAKDIVELGRETFQFLVHGDSNRKAREIPFRNSPSDPIVISSSPEPSYSSVHRSPSEASSSRPPPFSTPRRPSDTVSSNFSETPLSTSPFSLNFPSSSTSTLPSSSHLVPPPPFSSSRKRMKGSMGPPPIPRFDSSTRSVLSTSEASTSGRSTPRSAVERELKNLDLASRKRNYQNRDHIRAAQHKREVEAVRKSDLEEMQKTLFVIRQKEGYGSDFNTFRGFLEYKAKLEQLSRRDFFSPSPSLGNLRSRYTVDAELQRTRRHSDADNKRQWLERQLEMAKQTLSGPKPPSPFSPTLEQLRIKERAKDDEIEQRLRPKRQPLPSSLSPEDEAQVNALLKKRGVISKYAREQVSDQDISRLKPSTWLNDEVINFYGALILGRSEECKENKENQKANGVASGKKPLNVHYFSTFFWSKLEKEGYEKGRLAKWTKKVDIFSKDVILVPVNHNNTHWTGAAVNFRKKRIESHDSMNVYRNKVFQHLRNYLDAEHRNKKKAPFDFTGWEDYTSDDTPQQENGFDCGVFTCQFLESISRGEDTFNFSQKDIPYLRRRMIWEIGNARLKEVP